MGLLRRCARIGRAALTITGALAVLGLVWLLTSWPLGLDRWLDVSGPPEVADAIVCLGGGTTTGQLPTDEGWRRIYTASQLFIDRYAPLVVFSGRGSQNVSEAEVYAEAAVWLGVAANAIAVDVGPGSTAEHPLSVLKSAGGRIRRDSRILLVTSPMHSRRALLAFRKQGFSHIRVVSTWQARRTAGTVPGHAAASSVAGFVRDNKAYTDPLFHLQGRSRDVLFALRECSALAWYWWRGAV